MAPVLSCLAATAALSGVMGARVSSGRKDIAPSAKFIAGVPVLNYEKAHRGMADASGELDVASLEEDWIVMLTEDTKDDEVSSICGRAGTACKMVGHPSEGGVPFFEVRGAEADLERILEGTSSAQFIEPNPTERILDPEVEEEEDEFSTQETTVWNVMRVGKETAKTKGKGVHVYVVDSGTRTTHVDFGGRAIPTLDMTTGQVCKGDVSCATDSVGHGTHCAGTVGGTTYGLATESTVHAVKISFDGEGTWSKTIGAFDWIILNKQKPAVVSLSAGGEGNIASMNKAVDSLVAAGVTVLTSAGNSGKDACAYTPANVPSCISVGAVSAVDTRAAFSNFGSCVDIWAPGTNILSASPSSDTSSIKKQGTSMACPLVAAAAAVLLEASPSMSPAQVRNALTEKALDGWVLDGLKEDDTNKLLWVGEGTPPPAGFYEPCRRRRRILCYK